MIDVLILHAPQDRSAAEEIAAQLDRGAEAKVWLEDCREGVHATWDFGLSSAAILLLLSRASVPAKTNRDLWGALLAHVRSGESPALGCVLLEDCPHPALLERKSFFRWQDGGVLRAMARWVLSFNPPHARPPFVPAALPWFEGRERELDDLYEALVDRHETVFLTGAGKTCLAQRFARQASGHFRDVVWVSCAGLSRAFVLSELAEQLGISQGDSLGLRVAETLANHRLLVVLDDGSDALAGLPAGGRSSMLIAGAPELAAAYPHARVMHLPELPAQAQFAEPGSDAGLRLWEALSVCRRSDASLALAATIAGLDLEAASESCARLIARRIVDPFDDAARRVRVSKPAAIRDREGLERRRAQELLRRIARARRESARSIDALLELETALQRICGVDWELATHLAFQAAAFLREQRSTAEAELVLIHLQEAAQCRNDGHVMEACLSELSWLRGTPHSRTLANAGQMPLPLGL